ncbi:MAG: hypothetical protein OXI26_14000 [bacterium]|nr:hypothetical protein [bacterium]
MDRPVPASFWRGGTSRAVLFRAEDLATYEPWQVEAIILAALGSPDPDGRQIDGLGGGISSLSKAAIVGPAPAGSGADVAFRFAQVEVAEPSVDFAGNCGNISAAIAPFAVNEGLVAIGVLGDATSRQPGEGMSRTPIRDPVPDSIRGRDPGPGPTETRAAVDVEVLSLNTGQRFRTRVPLRAGRYDPSGAFAIGGVPGTGARLTLEYLEPDGSIGRGALPTGLVRESVDVPGCGAVPVSIIDVGNPAVFVAADALGAPAAATALPTALDADAAVQERLEWIRCEAAVRIGMAESPTEAARRHRTVPKVAVVGSPAAYRTTSDTDVPADDVDLVVRLISMGRTHRTLAMTGAMACAAATAMDGSVVAEVAAGSSRTTRAAAGAPTPSREVRLGHPAGVLALNVTADCLSGTWRVAGLTMDRTAREIMRGAVQVPQAYLDGQAWFLPGSSH